MVARGACVVLFGGACMVLFGGGRVGGCAWFYLGGMHGFIWEACMVLFGGMHGFIQSGVCGVIQGGMRGFIRGACMVLFNFFRYNEIRSMTGRYTSYWNAFLF